MKKIIRKTELDLATKKNHFQNIVDNELADIVIEEISILEKKLNYYYKKAKERAYE